MAGLGYSQRGGQQQAFSDSLKSPSDEDIELELGRDFTRALNYDKTAEDKAYKCLTWAVYNWEEKRVQVLEVTQISISRQFVKYGLHKTYSKNLLDWDFQMEKGNVGGKTKYDLDGHSS